MNGDALERCDVFVVGGGINGAGIARDLAGRGLSVMLCERDDLASHTSSASSKLIHGGLRYLEHYELGLVRKALREREVLLRCAPHIMGALRVVMPHDPTMRPAWMIRAGLFLYDHLAHREWLPASRMISLARHRAGAALQPRFRRGFVYSDGRVDDARLVVLCALDAAERGATILPRTEVNRAEPSADGQQWLVRVRPDGADPRTIHARLLVNAAGPWAASFLQEHTPDGRSARPLRLVRGSHIVVPRLFDHEWAYIIQNLDGRIVFAIPYEGDFTLVGTTDAEHHGDPSHPQPSPEEIDYLCELLNRTFRRQVGTADVVWSFAGVRPLLDDEHGNPAEITRDYRLELNHSPAPLLNVWGGKITTFRKLAEQAGDRICEALGAGGPAWTETAVLPGGDLVAALSDAPASADASASSRRRLRYAESPATLFGRFVSVQAQRYPWLPPALLLRWAHQYGTRLTELLGDPPARQLADLGAEVAPGLFETELRYLVQHEWARSADDVLWRRTKLGLHLPADATTQVQQWLEKHRATALRPARPGSRSMP